MTLIEAVRATVRRLHYSARTEEAYVHWIRQFIRFHKGKHPRQMGAEEMTAYLNELAVKRRTSASTQNQALCALLFLYKRVLNDRPTLLPTARATSCVPSSTSSRGATRRSLPRAAVRSTCLMRCARKCRAPRKASLGNICFPRRGRAPIQIPADRSFTTSTHRPCKGLCKRLDERQGSPIEPHAIHSATASRRTCLRQGPTSEQFKRCSGTRT